MVLVKELTFFPSFLGSLVFEVFAQVNSGGRVPQKYDRLVWLWG
jgi:hypothetical protein